MSVPPQTTFKNMEPSPALEVRMRPQDQAHEGSDRAVRGAFNATFRRLEDHVRRLAGQVKRHEAPLLRSRVANLSPMRIAASSRPATGWRPIPGAAA